MGKKIWEKSFPSVRGRDILWRLCHSILLFIFLAIYPLQSGCTNSSDKELVNAEAAYEKKDYNRALALSDAILQKSPTSLSAHRLKALSHLSQGDLQGTFNHYEIVEKKYPEIALPLLKEIALVMIRISLTHENYFVRSAAVKAIGEMGDPALIPLITPSLRDKETFVRFFAVESLGLLGGPETLKLLLAAGKDPDGMVRIAAVKAIDEMEGEGAHPTGVQMDRLFATFTDDTEPTVRFFALAAMAKRGESKAFSELMEIIEKWEGPPHPAGAVALGRSKNPEAVPYLTQFLNEPDPTIRMYAAEAMGEIPSPAIYAPLEKAMADPDPAVRGAAATSLGKLGDPRAIPLLTRVMADPDPMARISAAEGLKRLGKNEEAVYQEALTHEDYGIRHFAIGSLRKIGGKEALPILRQALADSAPRVRIAVVRAIGENGDLSSIPLLKESLKDPDLAVRTYAAGNIGRILNKSAGKTLKKKEGE